MQAIQVKYLGSTNTKASRVKAECYCASLSISIDDSMSVEENMRQVTFRLIEKLGWKGRWVGGCLKNQNHVFVCIDWNCDLRVELK